LGATFAGFFIEKRAENALIFSGNIVKYKVKVYAPKRAKNQNKEKQKPIGEFVWD
jgi:hypothetical protein